MPLTIIIDVFKNAEQDAVEQVRTFMKRLPHVPQIPAADQAHVKMWCEFGHEFWGAISSHGAYCLEHAEEMRLRELDIHKASVAMLDDDTLDEIRAVQRSRRRF